MKRLITICAVMGILLTASADVKAVLDTRLMLHFDGNDAATTTFDSSPPNHSITLTGGAQLDTFYQAAGTASLLLDGSNDYASSPDSTDWDIAASATNDWTVDFYVRLDTHSATTGLMGQGLDNNNRWAIRNVHGSGLTFLVRSSSSEVINTGFGGEITDSNWHWIALCKVGPEYAIYKDGTQVNYTTDTSTANFTGALNIGRTYGPSYYYTDGNMDEVRIFYGNPFDASPNSGKTDIITNIPEPATISLLGLGVLSLLRRKRSV